MVDARQLHIADTQQSRWRVGDEAHSVSAAYEAPELCKKAPLIY